MRLLAEPLIRDGGDVLRIVQRAQQQQRRAASVFAMMRGEPDTRHRPRALRVGHDAIGRVHDFAELQPLDRDKFHVAVPIDADRTIGEIRIDRERRVADEAGLAAGAGRLARLPVFRLALDDEGLQTTQRIGAALGGNRLLHKLGRRLG